MEYHAFFKIEDNQLFYCGKSSRDEVYDQFFFSNIFKDKNFNRNDLIQVNNVFTNKCVIFKCDRTSSIIIEFMP